MECEKCKQIRIDDRTRKFCSKSCNVAHQNSVSPKKKKKKKEKPCLYCSDPTENPKFCSTTCCAKYRPEEYIRKWKSGNYQHLPKYYRISPESPIRAYLLKKYNNKCSLCSWNEINPSLGYSPLEVDHIDGNWQNPAEDNLRILCPNCHALQPTYRNLNKGRNKSVGDIYFYKRKINE